MEKSRTQNSILNSSTGFIILMTRTILSFVVRIVFIRKLGEECLGISSVFTNVISMLSLTELGISNAITFSLYKPLAEKDYRKVSMILSLYRKLYKVIGILIGSVGLLLIPVIPYMLKDVTYDKTILVYLLYLFNIVNMYFLSYRENLIYADQKFYKMFKLTWLCWISVYTIQFLVLIFINDFLLYVSIEFICLFIYRLIYNFKTKKYYPMIDFHTKEKLPESDLKPIIVNIKSLFMQKIGNYFVNGFDSIITSTILGVAIAGLYTNYLSLVNMFGSLLATLYTGITSSFGNLFVTGSKKEQESAFNKINFFAYIIYSFSCIEFMLLIDDFVTICYGEQYVLDFKVVFLIVIYFYFAGMRSALDVIKDAAGLYYQDRYIPIFQALINLVLSIPLAFKFGLIGIPLGTVISFLALPFWHRPYNVYKNAFKKNPFGYYIDYIVKFVFMAVIYLVCFFVLRYIKLDINIITFVIKGCIVFVIYGLFVLLFYRKNENFQFFVRLLVGKFRELLRRKG